MGIAALDPSDAAELSIGAYARVAYDFAQFFQVGFYDRRKLGGCVAYGVRAFAQELLLHIRTAQHAQQLAIEASYDGGGRFGRREDADYR